VSDEDEVPTLGIAQILPTETVDAVVFWNWYETIKERGIDQAHQMAVLSVKAIAGSVSEDQESRLRHLLEIIEWRAELSTDRKEQALLTSYNLLQSRDWDRARAARFARWLLGKEIEPEAWRKAVNKWAKEQGKPELKLPHGRPSKRNRNNR